MPTVNSAIRCSVRPTFVDEDSLADSHAEPAAVMSDTNANRLHATPLQRRSRSARVAFAHHPEAVGCAILVG